MHTETYDSPDEMNRLSPPARTGDYMRKIAALASTDN
jgi:hypothetical protein